MPAARPAAVSTRLAPTTLALAFGALLLSSCLGRTSGFGLGAAPGTPRRPSTSSFLVSTSGAGAGARAGFGRQVGASASSVLQQLSQSRPSGFAICGSSMARHSSSSSSGSGGGGLHQEATGSDDDGAGGGSGGLLLHAFTLIGKSTRWTVAGMVGAVLLWRRDAAVVTFTAGAILNALFGKVLKRIIKEARPDGAVLEDPGMPSSHAMALFYMTAFLTKALCEGKGSGLPPWWPLGYAHTIALILAYVAVASSWRVDSGLHTPAQILVGAGVGATVGAGWQELCTAQLNARVVGLLSRYPGSRVPLPYVAGVMLAGALTVGSVERKIARAMKRIVAKGKKGKGKTG